MANKMIIDASHPEETRVVVLRGNRVEEFDFESASKRPLRGNIYLAKVTRVEPSLQAAFVDYGGNRHGFLAFSEIHPDYYQIPVADRQALLEEEALSQREEDEEASGERRSRRHRRPRRTGGRGARRERSRRLSERAPADELGRTNSLRRLSSAENLEGNSAETKLAALVRRRKRCRPRRARSRPGSGETARALWRGFSAREPKYLPSQMRRRPGRRPFKLQWAPRRAAKAPKPLDRRTNVEHEREPLTRTTIKK